MVKKDVFDEIKHREEFLNKDNLDLIVFDDFKNWILNETSKINDCIS